MHRVEREMGPPRRDENCFVMEAFTRALLLLAALLVPLPGDAQTSGIIQTKPVCFPAYGQVFGAPPFHTIADQYIEGPDPVVLDNGDIAIFVDVGAGVYLAPGSTEALEALVYSWTLPPRWYPIYSTDNWGTKSAYAEAEGAFPSVRYFNGAWRTMYTSTLDYSLRRARCPDPGQPPVPCTANYDRTGRIDSTNPLWPPAARDQWWLQPATPACQNHGIPPPESAWDDLTWIQTCPNVGSGFPNALKGFDETFWVYHTDGNYTPCTGYVRTPVNTDLTYGLPSCVGGLPSQVFDVSTGDDGYYHLLGSDAGPYPPGAVGINEWSSTDGVSWSLNVNRAPYTANCAALGLAADCWVSGAAYLKNKFGRIIEPRVAVGTVGNGGVLGGHWRLFYWADAGAVLPPSWGLAAASCPVPNLNPGGVPNYGGSFDGVSYAVAAGWAWDWYQPNTPVSVDIFADGMKVATVSANQYRGDLAVPGDVDHYYGNGFHGFQWGLPEYLLDGAQHTISIRYAGTSQELAGSPRTLYQGNHDASSCYETSGWVWNAMQPQTPITADLLVDGVFFQSVVANQFRGDLLNAGIGDGRHGFRWATPGSLRDGVSHTVTLRYGGTTQNTSNTPRTLQCAPARFYTIEPCRIVDTRNANGPYGGPAIGAQSARTFTLAGTCGIPSTATAVVLNVTVIGASSGGSFTLYPSALPVPTASSVSFSAGQTRANFGIFGVDSAGQMNVFCGQASGTANVILDAAGYFQ